MRLAPDLSDPCNAPCLAPGHVSDASIRNGPRRRRNRPPRLELSPESGKAGCLDTLAAALAENGEFAEAIETQIEAVSLMDDFDRRLRYQQRLALYEDGVAYREEPEDETSE